jgi:hypothetical protein
MNRPCRSSDPCVSVNLILGRIIAALRDEAGDSQVKFAARFKKKPVNLGPDVVARLEVGRSATTAPQLYWIERHFVDKRALPRMGSIFTLANACERKLKRRGVRVIEKAPRADQHYSRTRLYSLVQEMVYARNTGVVFPSFEEFDKDMMENSDTLRF